MRWIYVGKCDQMHRYKCEMLQINKPKVSFLFRCTHSCRLSFFVAKIWPAIWLRIVCVCECIDNKPTTANKNRINTFQLYAFFVAIRLQRSSTVIFGMEYIRCVQNEECRLFLLSCFHYSNLILFDPAQPFSYSAPKAHKTKDTNWISHIFMVAQ